MGGIFRDPLIVLRNIWRAPLLKVSLHFGNMMFGIYWFSLFIFMNSLKISWIENLSPVFNMTHSLVVLAISDDVNLMDNKKEGSAQQKHVKLFCNFMMTVLHLARSGNTCICNTCFISSLCWRLNDLAISVCATLDSSPGPMSTVKVELYCNGF